MSKTRYYVNETEQANGDHEVHEDDCYWLLLANKKKDLGEFYLCSSAVAAAIALGYNANGCKHCSEPCHTS